MTGAPDAVPDEVPADLAAEIESLAARLNDATARQQAEVEREAAERAARQLAHQRQRLAGYDRAATFARVRAAEQGLRTALLDDATLAPIVELYKARWGAYNAAATAAVDAAMIAKAGGTVPPPIQGVGIPEQSASEMFLRLLDSAAHAAMQDEQAEADELTAAAWESAEPEVIAAAEAQAAQAERQAAATPSTNHSVPAASLTEADRKELGLPPARSSRDPSGGRTLGA